MNREHALVTGGAGFSGSHLVDGLQTRDVADVSDVVHAGIFAPNAASREAPALNAPSATETSILGIAHKIRKLFGRTTPPAHAAERPGDIRRCCGSKDAIRSRFGWAPTIGLEEGLAELAMKGHLA